MSLPASNVFSKKDPRGAEANQPAKERVFRTIGLTLGIAALLVLFLSIIFSPHHTVYDEGGNLSNLHEVHRIGWIAALTSPSSHSAVGPLFTAIQFACEWWTGLSAPAIRLPNFMLFVGLLLVLARTAQLLQLRYPALAAFSFVGVPFVWASVGMALTEIPALFCYTASVWICLQLAQSRDQTSRPPSLALAVAGGVLLGLACLGRQTYLVTLIALPFLLRRDPKTWLVPVLIAFFALAVCGWLFWFWHGFVPPGAEGMNAQLKWSHGVLSFSYLAMATLFVAPGWLLLNKTLSRKESALLYAIGLGAALFALAYPIAEIAPARTLMGRILTPSLFAWYPRVISGLLAGLAAVWLIRFAREVWTCRGQGVWLFIHCSLLTLALMPIKISHQFSSRYVVTDIGLLVLVVWKRHSPNGWFFVMRLGLGIFVGALILRTYFLQ